jgi:hypothetical protein
MSAYPAKNHRLANGDGAIDIRKRTVFIVRTATINEILLDVVEAQLITSQSQSQSVWHDGFSKLHDIIVVCSRKQQQLTVLAQGSTNSRENKIVTENT